MMATGTEASSSFPILPPCAPAPGSDCPLRTGQPPEADSTSRNVSSIAARVITPVCVEWIRP